MEKPDIITLQKSDSFEDPLPDNVPVIDFNNIKDPSYFFFKTSYSFLIS